MSKCVNCGSQRVTTNCEECGAHLCDYHSRASQSGPEESCIIEHAASHEMDEVR